MKKLLREKHIGYNLTIDHNKLLGNGSYGKVYLCTDEKNHKYAVKYCPIDENGIPNILETTLMNSVQHIYINKALVIKVTDKVLYMVQELAVMDLARKTRGDSISLGISIEQKISWCYALTQAVACLHSQNIIHCDIKASNILLFNNDSIKLTDFTLTLKKWAADEKFNHRVCTRTHRPLECFLKEEWDENVDIWSLGCTFYEIFYGHSLFPDQTDTKGFINALIYWAQHNKEAKYENNDFYKQEFTKPIVDKMQHESFDDLLRQMLKVDVTQRINIFTVLQHPIFTSKGQITKSSLGDKSPESRDLLDKSEMINIYKTIKIACDIHISDLLSKKIDKMTDNVTLKHMIIYLHQCSLNLERNSDLKLYTAYFIALKLRQMNINSFWLEQRQFTKEEILQTEIDMCLFLNFRLINF